MGLGLMGGRTHSGRRDPGSLKLCPRWCRRSTPTFPGFLPWLSPSGMDLDFRGIQGKPEATRTCLQQEPFGSERQSWEVEVPALTFPRDPLQAGLGVLLYQHTVVEYLLSMCQAWTRESHALIGRYLTRDSVK